MVHATHKNRLCNARRGYLYLAVMGTAVVVSTIGLTALSVSALKLKAATANQHWLEAELLAHSAVEDALQQIKTNLAWRTSFINNTVYPVIPRALGNGTYTFQLIDDDGSLSDDDADGVKILGIGRVGNATVAESIRLLPNGPPLSCLEASLHSQGSITLGALVNSSTNQIASTNGNFSASAFLANFSGNVDAVGTISGTVSGTKNSGIIARKMPTSAAFDYYKDNGTWIQFSSIPQVSGVTTIEKIVLAPTLNPYGPSGNPEGIYVIDCGGNRIVLQNCRILGTLLLINPATNSSINGSVSWNAAVGNYPALLVEGSIEMRTSNIDLDESTLARNFNPPGAPYAGVTNTNTTDKLKSEINGLVYVSNTMNLPADALDSVFRGVVVCNAITVNSTISLNYRIFLKDNPPPGFARGNPMMVSPGSRRRESL
jgi:hypothetical protein